MGHLTRKTTRNLTRALRVLALTAGAAALATTALADSHDGAPKEDSNNLSLIGATDYFESLGWNYTTGDWTGTVTWDPYDSGTPITLTTAERDAALGAGATVAILDGLANETHTDLPYDPNGDPTTDSVAFIFTGFPFSPSYTAPDLHGTHTSGIIGARLNGGDGAGGAGMSGVAPMVRLLNYAVFDDNGWVGADEDEVLTHAVSYGATVANMSYGPTALGDFTSSTTLKAINNHKSDIVVVKAAGNDGVVLVNETLKGRDNNPVTNLIIAGSVVMTVDASGNITPDIAWYSNTPGNACIVTKGICVVALKDIFMVAPGGSAIINADRTAILVDENGYIDGIWSTDEFGGYYRISGTSMAAPHIAGAVALLHSQWPILKSDPQTTRQILFDTAIDLGATGVDGVYGQGLLNVKGAMSPIGAPEFGITTGGGGDGGGGGGGKGNNGKKPKKTVTWALSDTSMTVGHGFSALTETRTTISVFDKYRRDFSVPLSALVGERRSALSERLELMVASGFAWSDEETFVPGRGDLLEAVTIDYRNLGDDAPRNLMASLDVASIDDYDVRFFAGTGNALPLLYSPGVMVGGMASSIGSISGINPVLGFAAGEHFAGASVDRVGPFRFAAGYSEKSTSGPLLDAYKAGAVAASVTFAVSEDQGVNVAVTDLRERGGVFGSRSEGALSFGKEARTRAMSLSWDHANWRGLALTASWTLGVSEGDSNGLLSLGSGTLSDAFHIGIAKSGLLGDRDHVAISLSQPLRVRSGSVQLYADKALDEDAVMQMQSEAISLVPSGRELDLQVEYRFGTAGAGTFSTFAYHAIDAGHIAGRQESGLGVKYQMRF